MDKKEFNLNVPTKRSPYKSPVLILSVIRKSQEPNGLSISKIFNPLLTTFPLREWGAKLCSGRHISKTVEKFDIKIG